MFGAFRKVRRSWRAGAVVLGFVLLGGSVAIADIPDGNVINACRDATTGALRVIDKSAGAKCSTGEALLSWNRWRWRSVFLPRVQYYVADVVSYQGSSYIARVRPPVGTRPTNTSYWGLIASKGAIGLPGLPGLPGLAGATGIPGVAGATGLPGTAGATGIPGVAGATGLPGAAGATGPQGVQGLVGATGPQGVQGAQGLAGATGPQGVQGVQGLAGATGPQGLPGAQGLAGATGPQGIQGMQGPTGVGADPIFAKINSNGSVAYGNHVTTASVLANTYTINFDQNVSQCAVNAISEQAVAIPVITGRGPMSISLNFTLPTAIPALTANTFDVTLVC